MTDFQIITDYNLNAVWVLKDTNLIDMAVGKLASLGSDQGLQLQAQTAVLQKQVKDIEYLRDLMTKFTADNFVRFDFNTTNQTYKVSATWDISDIAGAFPNRSLASASDATIQRLINFYNGINQVYADIGSTTRLEPNCFRFYYKNSAADTTTIVRTSTRPPGVDASGQAYFIDDNGTRHDIILIKNEPFAVPENASEYQNWLLNAAATRADKINELLTSYQLSPVTGDTILWQVGQAGGTGAQFFWNTPVISTNRGLETEVGRVVQYTDPADPTRTPKYYRITKAFEYNATNPLLSKSAYYEEVTPLTPLKQPLVFAPTADTLRDLRSRFSEASLQITQRNASQQLLVNSLLVSYNYHFDAAANVLKAFNDLRGRLAGNV